MKNILLSIIIWNFTYKINELSTEVETGLGPLGPDHPGRAWAQLRPLSIDKIYYILQLLITTEINNMSHRCSLDDGHNGLTRGTASFAMLGFKNFLCHIVEPQLVEQKPPTSCQK